MGPSVIIFPRYEIVIYDINYFLVQDDKTAEAFYH